jgi:hypothetical protein
VRPDFLRAARLGVRRSATGLIRRGELDAAFEWVIEEAGSRLFCLLNRRDNGVEVRPIAGVEFGMEQFAIGANLESAATRGNQGKRFDALAELKDFGRQTDGLRRVVSNDAIFDRHLGFHRQSPFRNETIGAMK